jgi:hypothetical protein
MLARGGGWTRGQHQVVSQCRAKPLRSGQPLAEQLSERLGGVEEAVAGLRAPPAVDGDAEAAEMAARLSGRVSRLCEALDALGVG